LTLQGFDRNMAPMNDTPHRVETGHVGEEEASDDPNAHPAWGARKIVRCLERDGIAAPTASTVHAVLCRHGRIVDTSGLKGPAMRFEKPRPNQLWQMDFKGRVKLANDAWVHPLTVLDDHSRYALCLQACRNERRETVKPLLTAVFRTYGLPDAFYVDNGNPWGTGGQGQWTRLRVWLLKLGVNLIHSRPTIPKGAARTIVSTGPSRPRYSHSSGSPVSRPYNRPSTTGGPSTTPNAPTRPSTCGCRHPVISHHRGRCRTNSQSPPTAPTIS